MRIRIGYGLGTRAPVSEPDRFAELVDALETCGFDSLWLSERITGDCLDPLVGLAVAAGRTRRLKLGTSVQVLPGRNPMLVAKEWATLDRLSGGRALPAFGLGVADPAEQQAFGVERSERAAWFDEALPLLRRLWSGEAVDHDGPRFRLRQARVQPTPSQSPLDVWLGGLAPSELRRVGRMGDGWLPSFCTPTDVDRGRAVIVAAADAVGRSIDEEHWGALVPYLVDEPAGIPDPVVAVLRARRPDIDDPTAVVAIGLADLRTKLEAFCTAGASKFVVVPIGDPPHWADAVTAAADALLDLQS